MLIDYQTITLDKTWFEGNWISTRQAAEMLGVKPRCVVKLCHKGRLEYTLINSRCLYIMPCSLRRLIYARQIARLSREDAKRQKDQGKGPAYRDGEVVIIKDATTLAALEKLYLCAPRGCK